LIFDDDEPPTQLEKATTVTVGVLSDSKRDFAVGFGSRGPKERKLGIGIGCDLLVEEDIAHGVVALDRGLWCEATYLQTEVRLRLSGYIRGGYSVCRLVTRWTWPW